MSARFKYYTLDDSVHVEFRAVHGRGEPYPSTQEAVAVLRVPEVLYSRQATTVVLDAYVSYRLRHRRPKPAVSADLDALFRAMPQISRQIAETRERYRLPSYSSSSGGSGGSGGGSGWDSDSSPASPVSVVSELSLTDSEASTHSTHSSRSSSAPESPRVYLHQDAGPVDPDSLQPLEAPPPYDAAQLAHLEQRARDLEIALEQSERARKAAENELRVSRASAQALAARRSAAANRRQRESLAPLAPPRGVCSTVVARAPSPQRGVCSTVVPVSPPPQRAAPLPPRAGVCSPIVPVSPCSTASQRAPLVATRPAPPPPRGVFSTVVPTSPQRPVSLVSPRPAPSPPRAPAPPRGVCSTAAPQRALSLVSPRPAPAPPSAPPSTSSSPCSTIVSPQRALAVVAAPRPALYSLPPRRSSIRSSAPLCSNVASRDWRPPAVGNSPVTLRRIW